MARTNWTIDHDLIRRWAEERGAEPAATIGTRGDGDPGLIRFDFPGDLGAGKLRPLSWEEWFKKFDEADLALVYEEETAEGEKSHYNRLVTRPTPEQHGVEARR